VKVASERRDQIGTAGSHIVLVGIRRPRMLRAGTISFDGELSLAPGANGHVAGQGGFQAHHDRAGRDRNHLAAVGGFVAFADGLCVPGGALLPLPFLCET